MATQIKQFLKDIIPQEHSWKIILLKNWSSIIGEFSGKVIIEKIQNDVLFLGVSHPVYAQELFLMTDDLKKKVNSILKEERINKIQFRFINFDKIIKNRNSNNYCCSNNKKQPCQPVFKNMEIATLTQSEFEQLKSISDEALRESLHKFYLRCKK